MALSWPLIMLVAAACLSLSAIRPSDANKPPTTGGQIWGALAKFLANVGWAALLALLIIAVLRAFTPLGASPDTIAELNAKISELGAWLKYAWVAYVLALLAAFGGLLVFRNELSRISARGAFRTVGWAKTAGGVFAVLTASSFVAAEANASAPVAIADAKAQRAKLVDVQLELLNKTQIVLVREAIDAAIEQVADASVNLNQTTQAYAHAIAFLNPALGQPVDLATENANWRNIVTLRPNPQRTQAATENLAADLGLSRDYNGPTDETISAGTAADTTTAQPASRLDQAERRTLADDIVKIIFSAQAKEIKKAIWDVQNPLLKAVVDAFVDPLLIDPVKSAAAKQAQKFVDGSITLADATERMRGIGRTLGAKLGARAAPLGSPAQEPGYGEPEWDRVRETMRTVIDGGLRGKGPKTQEEARNAFRRLGGFERDAHLLLSAGAARKTAEEVAFSRYLDSDPTVAALWGYGVISLTPDNLKPLLRNISIAESGPKIAQIRMAIDRAVSGSLKAQSALQDMGFDYNHDKDLSDTELAAKLYESHKAYPLDGYSLYFHAVAPARAVEATSYYRSEPVGRAVSEYCPSEPKTS